jgi:hypothetical protein
MTDSLAQFLQYVAQTDANKLMAAAANGESLLGPETLLLLAARGGSSGRPPSSV